MDIKNLSLLSPDNDDISVVPDLANKGRTFLSFISCLGNY
jgi:hypothetical protein